jgi:hypothetical protein
MNVLENQPALPETDRGQWSGMMAASNIITDLRQRGFTVYATEQGLFVVPKRDLSEEDRATIRARKWELMATLRDEQIGNLCDSLVEMRKHLSERLSQMEWKLRDAEGWIEMLKMENHWLRRDAALRRNHASELDDETLRKAKLLCHPDKHGGSKLANDVFVALQHIQEQRRARP